LLLRRAGGGNKAQVAGSPGGLFAIGIQHSRRREGYKIDLNGIIVIDKPAGWTSHDVVAKLRGILKEKRIGHGGTLDPIATGVLPVFIGNATRAAEFCENAEKEYIAGLKLGLVTDTQDITGKTIRSCEAHYSTAELSAIITAFIGKQLQIPPMYAAKKKDGKKLYELARRGVETDRPAREIIITELELLEGAGSEFALRVVCSKGTYIRALCHDIGLSLGCGGAMSSLRRIRAGRFNIEMAHTLGAVQDDAAKGSIEKVILQTDTIFSAYPSVELTGIEAEKCRNGAPCQVAGLQNGTYRFYGPDGRFMLLGEVVGGYVRAIKRFFAQ